MTGKEYRLEKEAIVSDYVENVDELTNEAMAILREEYKIDPDSDVDDKLYGVVREHLISAVGRTMRYYELNLQ